MPQARSFLPADLTSAWSLLIGRIPQIKPNEIKVQKPIIMDEIEKEQWAQYTDAGTAGPENPSLRQESNLRRVFTAFSDLSEIIHETIMFLYSNERVLNGPTLVSIYLQYLQWYDGLPDCLRLGTNSTPVVLFAQYAGPPVRLKESEKLTSTACTSTVPSLFIFDRSSI